MLERSSGVIESGHNLGVVCFHVLIPKASAIVRRLFVLHHDRCCDSVIVTTSNH
jgi:hypothetical protein